MKNNSQTSWEKSAGWYHKIVGDKGHYYHQSVIIPGVIKMLKIKPGDRVLDLACGEGVLSRQLPKGVNYLGVDISKGMIEKAKREETGEKQFMVADATKEIRLGTNSFEAATIILAFQNFRKPEGALDNAAKALKKGGKLLLVLNHPIFRIPRFSAWGVDEQRKIQYRRIDRYLTSLEIPINMHPGEKNSEETLSFHYPLSAICGMLRNNGFIIENIEEWVSDKKSYGGAAKMENRARSEFPMFMAIGAVKL